MNINFVLFIQQFIERMIMYAERYQQPFDQVFLLRAYSQTF